MKTTRLLGRESVQKFASYGVSIEQESAFDSIQDDVNLIQFAPDERWYSPLRRNGICENRTLGAFSMKVGPEGGTQ
jgi:hypothetical protein